MPKIAIAEGLEIEVRDKDGVLEMSSLPESLRTVVQAEFDRAYGKGAAKAGEDAKKQLETAVEQARKEAKAAGGDPVLAERAKNLERELSKMKEDAATAEGRHVEAQKLRDERHADELKDRDAKLTERDVEIKRRTDRISELVTADIRIAAQRHGARNESLPELDTLLRGRIGLDKDLQAYVKDEKDPEKPAMGTDGKTPVTIDGLVQQYLTDHPHHKAAASGRGGNAPGGSSLAGGKGADRGEFGASVDRAAQNPSLANVTDAISKAGQRKAS